MPISAQDICGMLGECLDVTYSVVPAASSPEDFTLHLQVKNTAHSRTSGPFIEFHDLEVKVAEASDGETTYAKLRSGKSEETPSRAEFHHRSVVLTPTLFTSGIE